MADPLSIIGAIVNIVQVGSQIIGFIKTAKESTRDRQKLLCEVRSSVAVCQSLQDSIEMGDAAEWRATLNLLDGSDSPIAQLATCFRGLKFKLAPQPSSSKTLVEALRWPFDKRQVQDVFATIERQKNLLNLALTNDNLMLSREIQRELRGVARNVENISIHVTDERRAALLAKVSNINYDDFHSNLANSRADSTGGWLLESAEFRDWEAKPGVLFCKGIPGSGKTILSSLVVDHLRRCQSEGVAIVKIYCRYNDPLSAEDLIRSVLRQLLESLKALPIFVDDHFASDINRSNLFTHFSTILCCFRNVKIVVDALDECHERVQLVQFLGQRVPNATLHVLYTCRIGTSDVERKLEDAVHLEIRSNETDVRKYIHERLRSNDTIPEFDDSNPDLFDQIVDAILPRLEGMFLLARLYMDLLADLPTQRDIREALRTLPEGRDKTYVQAWDRVNAQTARKRELGKQILLWVVNAERPLRLAEMQHALGVREDDDELDTTGFISLSTLTSYCAGLVVVDEQRKILTLVHATAQEFFDVHKGELFPMAHEVMAMTCLTYLNLHNFRAEGALSDSRLFTDRWNRYRLLGYAAVNWGLHAKRQSNHKITKAIRRLLDNSGARHAAKQALVTNNLGTERSSINAEWPHLLGGGFDADEYGLESTVSLIRPIHLAAFFDLHQIVQRLLLEGANVDELDGEKATALHWALLGDSVTTTQLLLEKGANPNWLRKGVVVRRWPMVEGFTLPLTLAAYRGNCENIKSLLKHGADINKQQPMVYGPTTALSSANYGRHTAAAELLIERGSDCDVEIDGISEIVLNDDMQILEDYVRHGVSRVCIQAALRVAAGKSHNNALRFLLESGANANGFEDSDEAEILKRIPITVKERDEIANEDMAQPFSRRDTQRAELLSKEYVTPLVNAISNSWDRQPDENLETIELLIDAGADVNRVSAGNVHDWCVQLQAKNP
ncbi:hypothetical protein P7C71_g2783, partial [Lecanoromycetidae sp. Uapishka_2]